jgi:hypothetical protein
MKISIGFATMTLILAILKLANVIEIDWLWVFSPIWIPLALAFGLLVILFIVGLIWAIFDR